jgi:hypothetical protein
MTDMHGKFDNDLSHIEEAMARYNREDRERWAREDWWKARPWLRWMHPFYSGAPLIGGMSAGALLFLAVFAIFGGFNQFNHPDPIDVLQKKVATLQAQVAALQAAHH